MIDETHARQVSMHGGLPLIVLDHPVVPRSEAAPRQLPREIDDVVVVRSQNFWGLNVIFYADEVPPFVRGVQRNMRTKKADSEEEWFLLRFGELLDSPRCDDIVALIFIACGGLSSVP